MYHNHIKIFGIISISGAAPKLSCGDHPYERPSLVNRNSQWSPEHPLLKRNIMKNLGRRPSPKAPAGGSGAFGASFLIVVPL